MQLIMQSIGANPRPFWDVPVSVIDDCKEHVEQNEEAAEDVENEEPGTLEVPIKLQSL